MSFNDNRTVWNQIHSSVWICTRISVWNNRRLWWFWFSQYLVDGVSITAGATHVWTYAAGFQEAKREPSEDQEPNCPCNSASQHVTPPFVGNDYYCESGSPSHWSWDLHSCAHWGSMSYSEECLCMSEEGCILEEVIDALLSWLCPSAAHLVEGHSDHTGRMVHRR